METLDIISDTWPCNFGDLQNNVEFLLKKFRTSMPQHGVAWPAQQSSHTKTMKAFKEHYVQFHLRSDNKRKYEPGEGERIFLRTQASPLESTYYLVSLPRREGSELAQAIIDMFEACDKIKAC